MDEKAIRCPKCGSEEIIHVSSGVDECGEWHTLECDECGKVWVLEKEDGCTRIS